MPTGEFIKIMKKIFICYLPHYQLLNNNKTLFNEPKGVF